MAKTIKELYSTLIELIGKELADIELKKWLQRQIAKARRNGSPQQDGRQQFDQFVEQVVNDLNERSGLQYRASSKETRALIRKLLNALPGTTIDDFQRVHDIKCHDWLGDSFARYLRPATLYQPKKFEGYLQEYYARSTVEQAKRRAVEQKHQTMTMSLTPWHEFETLRELCAYCRNMAPAVYQQYEMPREVRRIQKLYYSRPNEQEELEDMYRVERKKVTTIDHNICNEVK